MSESTPVIRLEEVFKLSGLPTYTFVEPVEYAKLKIAIRTPGRGVVIEGPSGIGKTTSVNQALSDLGLEDKALRLSARKSGDIDLIKELINIDGAGVVIVDDFHRLTKSVRKKLADHLKVLADEEREDVKLVIVGINRAGESLVQFGADLNTRIDVVPFEVNPAERVRRVVEKGEKALNIKFSTTDEIIESASGSFFLAQFLCHETCVQSGVTESQNNKKIIEISFEVVRERAMSTMNRRFMPLALDFATGTKLRREGRAPYLNVLKWLAEESEWSLQLDRAVATHPELKGSVGQIVEKGYLQAVIENKPGLSDIFHYEPDTHVLAVEDPQFVFFIRNILWSKFAQKAGFVNVEFESRYDFALSFAGADREVAKQIFELLQENEFEVFYDKNEQHRIMAEDIEDYLAPIYRSEAKYVICLLGPEFPNRIWTRFESDQFKDRFSENSVIPVWFTTAPPGVFDESTRKGGVVFDPEMDFSSQIQDIVRTLTRKVGEEKYEPGEQLTIVGLEEIEKS